MKLESKDEATGAVMKSIEADEPEAASQTDTTKPNGPTVNTRSWVAIGDAITQTSSSVDPSSVRYAHGEQPGRCSVRRSDSSPLDDPAALRLGAVEAHHGLFRLFHNMMPEIDRQDVRKSLRQTENINGAAQIYRCLPLVRHYLSNEMLQLGRELFKAILLDPPRWLLLALLFQCAPIFKEAMIHIIGNYPHYPWTKVLASDLPQAVLDLIRKKVDELRALKASIDRDLFTSSICISGESLTFPTLPKANFDTWFIVQLWQDWFRHSITKHFNAKHTIGALYRLMARGGDGYLDYKSVLESLASYKGKSFGSWNLELVEADLRIMKDFAQKRVKELVVNNSMLDVEEEVILHLTCIMVQLKEMPWNMMGA